MNLLQRFKIKPNQPITALRSLSFRYDKGTYQYGYVRYELERREGVCRATVKHDCVPDENAPVIPVDDAFVQQVTDCLNTWQVQRWDGFDKSDPRVLDGHSFTLSLWYGEDRHIYARGYMRWPAHYREFRDAMDELFVRLCPKEAV